MNEQPRRCSNGKCGNHPRYVVDPARPTRVEFVVLYPDGTYSDPSNNLTEIRALAEATGGKARARAKRNPA